MAGDLREDGGRRPKREETSRRSRTGDHREEGGGRIRLRGGSSEDHVQGVRVEEGRERESTRRSLRGRRVGRGALRGIGLRTQRSHGGGDGVGRCCDGVRLAARGQLRLGAAASPARVRGLNLLSREADASHRLLNLTPTPAPCPRGLMSRRLGTPHLLSLSADRLSPRLQGLGFGRLLACSGRGTGPMGASGFLRSPGMSQWRSKTRSCSSWALAMEWSALDIGVVACEAILRRAVPWRRPRHGKRAVMGD